MGERRGAPLGRELEERIAHMFRLAGCKVRSRARIPGARNSGHEIDVWVEFESLGLPDRWAIECKDQGGRVKKQQVLAFRQTVSEIGASRGILVSTNGFQRGAFEAVQRTNIALFTPRELETSLARKIELSALMQHETERERRLVLDAIAQLPGREQIVLVLYHFEGLTLREIAQRLGSSVTTAGRVKRRGEERLPGRVTAALRARLSSDNRTQPWYGADYDRVYALMSSEWSYDTSPGHPDRWSATNIGRRTFTSLIDGLEHLLISYSKREESLVPFTAERQPTLRVLSATRSDAGKIVPLPPHQRTGSRWAFRFRFDPPLSRGESADVTFEVFFPEYKLAFREDILAVTTEMGSGREYDYNYRNVAYPVEEYVLSAFLPSKLGAVPRGFEATRRRKPFAEEDRYIREHGSYQERLFKRDAGEGWLLRLTRQHPPLRTGYWISWFPPSRPRSGSGRRARSQG